MAPTRLASKPISINENHMSQGITTRSKQLATLKSTKDNLKLPNKRKADSPLKDVTAKRAAFGDITNAFNKSCATQDKDKVMPVKKVTVESKMLPMLKTVKPQTQNSTANNKSSKTKMLQRVATNTLELVQKHATKDLPKPIATRAQHSILKNGEKKEKPVLKEKQNQNKTTATSANSVTSITSAQSDLTDPSLYMTALENITPVDTTKEEYKMISEKLDKVNLEDVVNHSLDEEPETPHQTPEGVADFDKENWDDPHQVSQYAMDIFNYLKSREPLFVVDDYLSRMNGITTWMRALLVDWMVEVQESFELNHETLYLAVKLVDLYLTMSSKTLPEDQHLSKEQLQLLGAASLLISSKFDERIPPVVDDFLYICDGAYTLSQLLKMEINILRVVDFDLGMPLSYRFLRRYARCSRVSMPTLTLARFVLELCLLEYGLAQRSDSRMAAAALYIALRMKGLGGWTPTLQYYTGYKLKDILPIALEQNAVLHKKPKPAISTVRNKYSHVIFFEVAKVPLIDDSVLSS